MVALYLIGFLTPWARLLNVGPESTLWLSLSTLLARTGWMGLSMATNTVTCVAICCCLAGAVLRVWGTAYLGASVMRNVIMQTGTLVAGGPYRRFRNPLYAGTFVFSLGVSILMPPSGAVFFLIGMALLELLLISGEENLLESRLGDPYREYKRRVPRLLPSVGARVAPSGATPRWLQALAAETYPVAYTICFAVLAWRYNAVILIQALIICYGCSLVIRAAGVASC